MNLKNRSQCNVCMISLGCAKNQVDAEMLLFTLEQAGYKTVGDLRLADVAIVNTCGFIQSAKEESIDEILSLGKLKKTGRLKKIIVTGCLAERYGDEVLKELYEADACVEIGCNSMIDKIVDEVLEGKRITYTSQKENLPLCGGRVISTPGYYAYLKISEGCDNRCAYCAIPLIRGSFRSKRMEDIVNEAKELAADGVRELVVIAQDTTSYGKDIYGKLMLASLLKELCKIDGIAWIRLLYCYPDRITDELLDVIANEEKILKYIDLPLQHCSQKVLRAMNRKGSRESLTALMNNIKKRIPGVVLRTTLMVGFPGEDENDVNELMEFINDVKFQKLGCFAYSREENTPAYNFKNQVDEDVKLDRLDRVMECQGHIMDAYNDSLIGKTVTVITEGYDDELSCYYGRSEAEAPDVDGKILFTADNNVKIGDFLRVTIENADDAYPFGTAVKLDS